MSAPTREPHIGTLNEKPLHAALKDWIAEPGDRFEVCVGPFVADIVRGPLVIEIQTGSTFPLKRKLRRLLPSHAVHVVLPVFQRKTITSVDEAGTIMSKRLSPKRGDLLDVFNGLVNLREFLGDANLSIEVLLIHVEEVRRPCSSRQRRWREWEVQERRLIDVFDRVGFQHPGDFLAAIPRTLNEPFTTADLARAIGRPRRVAQRVAYCLREMDAIRLVGRVKEGILYSRNLGESWD